MQFPFLGRTNLRGLKLQTLGGRPEWGLNGGIEKDHGLAATADERQIALGVALMEIGETKGERATEFGSFAEDRTQLAFDLATVEGLGEVTSFKASSGSTGPLRDSRIAERRRLRRVCSSISSAVTLRWFFGFMGGV